MPGTSSAKTRFALLAEHDESKRERGTSILYLGKIRNRSRRGADFVQ